MHAGTFKPVTGSVFVARELVVLPEDPVAPEDEPAAVVLVPLEEEPTDPELEPLAEDADEPVDPEPEDEPVDPEEPEDEPDE